MNPNTNRIEELPRGAEPAPFYDIFKVPRVGKRVASFSGYHWKIKSINAETQEIVLEQDGLTSQGERIAAGMRLPKGTAPALTVVVEAAAQ